jgi:tetratricopeptide (TPR) repeat protein
MRYLPVLLLGILLCPGLSVTDESDGKNLRFAEALFAERDFYRAITEYKRFLFENPDFLKAGWITFRIGESYLAGGKQDAAINVFEDIRTSTGDKVLRQYASLAIARAYYQQGRLGQSLELLESLQPALQDPELSGYARYLSGCVLLKTGEIKKSQEAFNSVKASHRLAPQALWLAEKVPRAEELPEKSPVLAGVLSVIPGLGHIYIGDYAVAITALAWNGVFGFATYDTLRNGNYGVGSLLAALSLLWYSGTIYGAISGAHRYNRDARMNYYDYLDTGAGLDAIFPDPTFAGGILVSGSLP